MAEHLKPERISRLLDEPGADPAGRRHLEECAACQAEHERLGRLRMALSALGEMTPPPGEWEAVVERLDGAEAAGPAEDGAGGRALRRARRLGWPARAAAALLLFAGGIAAGLQLTAGPAGPEGSPGEGSPAGEPPPPATAPAAFGGDGALGLLSAWSELEGPLPAAVLQDGGTVVDPLSAAERLARLDALIQASQEAVRQAPADPVANGLLFQLVEARNALAERLESSIRLAGLEYR